MIFIKEKTGTEEGNETWNVVPETGRKNFNFVELAIQFIFFDKGFITSVNLMLCNAGLIQVDENLSLFTI